MSLNISKPREEVFEYLADIANHPEFTDHYLVDWRLTREESYGTGAGARFRMKQPLRRFNWADVTLAELEPPFRIVQRGRGGKYNRTRMLGTYTLQPGPSNSTRLEYTLETVPKLPSDRIMEALGGKQLDPAPDRQGSPPAAHDPRGGPRPGQAGHDRRSLTRRGAARLNFRRRERPPHMDPRVRLRAGRGPRSVRTGVPAGQLRERRRVRRRRAGHVSDAGVAPAEPVRRRGPSVPGGTARGSGRAHGR